MFCPKHIYPSGKTNICSILNSVSSKLPLHEVDFTSVFFLFLPLTFTVKPLTSRIRRCTCSCLAFAAAAAAVTWQAAAAAGAAPCDGRCVVGGLDCHRQHQIKEEPRRRTASICQAGRQPAVRHPGSFFQDSVKICLPVPAQPKQRHDLRHRCFTVT